MRTNYLIILLACFAFFSCKVPQDITYFQDVHDGSSINVSLPYQVKVQPGDKLRIIVSTQDERLSAMFNLQSGSNYMSSYGSSQSNQLGYTVDNKGYIDFPVIGKIRVAGNTRSQIAEEIKNELQMQDLVKNPVVVVDFLNMGVSVLGDVKTPGHYNITNDRYTILEAIADAGDLNITAERTQVKVIRQEVGHQQVYTVNLLNADSLYRSPVFFLQQNDVIYVDPNDKRKRESTTNGNTTLQYSFWMSLGSFLMSIALFVTKW